jgi:hypothetical protein
MTPIPLDFGWFNPDITKLPGGNTFKELTNGLGGFVLVALVIGFLLAAGSWAIGAATGNIQFAERGKQGTMGAALITLLVGGAAIILNFFYNAGTALH